MGSIFDELSARYPGLSFPEPATQQLPAVPPRGPWPPPPVAVRPSICPACAERDRPWVLIHRHLNHATSSIHRHITEMEHAMSQALDNANAQLANLNGTLTNTVVPALQQLAAVAAQAGSGVPEDAVQAIADGISTATSQLAAATQQAVAQLPAQ